MKKWMKYFGIVVGIIVVILIINSLIPKKEKQQISSDNKSPNPTVVSTQEPSQEPEIKMENTVVDVNLPKRVLMGYLHNFDNGSTCLKLSDVPASYNIVAIAFAEATINPGEITFQLDETLCEKLGGYTKEEFIEDVKFAAKKGQRVILSVGGERGTVVVDSEEAANRFSDSTYEIMKEYGFQGIDIDLENGVNATYMEKALRLLYEKMRGNLIITMAPQTIDMQSVSSEYFKLALNIKDILTIVNMQYYNSGSMMGQNEQVYDQGKVEFLTALAAIQLENGLRPDQVGLGLPSVQKAAGGGYVEPSTVVEALKSLVFGTKAGDYTPVKAYTDFRGVMTWSINWDATNNYAFANQVATELLKMNETTSVEIDETSEIDENDKTEEPSKTEGPKKVDNDTTWKENVAYNPGDLVSYEGINYECIQAHTALVGWEPPKVEALWKKK